MVINLRIGLEHLRGLLSQLVDWLLGFDADGDKPLFCKSEIKKYLADIEGKKQKLAAEYEESGTIAAATIPTKPRGIRTINYWSESGHFWRWQYTEKTIQKTHLHIMSLVDDPTIPFTLDDAMRVHELLNFLELTMDCQDVVGL